MTTDLQEFARRAVACKQWRWMPGMLAETGLRVVRRDDDGHVIGYYVNQWHMSECVPGSLPDLRDPATLGCLLTLVREAWGACVHVAPDTGWHVRRAVLPNGSTINLGIIADTEAAALVAALEAASCD